MTKAKYLNAQIGAKIRQIREDKKLRLGELSKQSRISIAMLSKIENGRVFPTLPTLIQVLETLNTDLVDFFSDFKSDYQDFTYTLVKKDNQQPSRKEDAKGFEYNLILNSTIEKSSLEVSLLTLSAGAKRKKVSTSGMELLYLIQGKVLYEIDDNLIPMEAGDTLFFDGSIPHVPHNNYSQDAILLVLYFLTMD